jgi:hypothetical protein
VTALAERLWSLCEVDPVGCAVCLEDRWWSWGELTDCAKAVDAELTAAGAGPGRRVGPGPAGCRRIPLYRGARRPHHRPRRIQGPARDRGEQPRTPALKVSNVELLELFGGPNPDEEG